MKLNKCLNWKLFNQTKGDYISIKMEKSKKQDKESMKKIFMALAFIGIITIIIGFIFLSLTMTYGIKNIKTPADYDEWYNLTKRKNGDKIIVKGIIDKKEYNPFGGGFAYSFNGADSNFICGNDIGGNGSEVIAEIEMSGEYLPVVSQTYQENKDLNSSTFLIFIGFSITIIGLVMTRIISQSIKHKIIND